MTQRQFGFDIVSVAAALVLVCGSFVGANAAPGASAAFSQALVEFNAHHYSSALSQFQNYARANRSDITSHYYMALCYQQTNQVSLAKQEYTWVATYSKDARLKAQAQAGMSQLGQYVASTQAQMASHISSPIGGSGKSGTAAGATVAHSNFASGRMKVYEFNTKWCHVCKRFDPIFNEVSSSGKYSSTCEFQQLDAEDSSNGDLVSKFSVHAYPTIVLTDSTGKVVKKFTGGTANAAGLQGILDNSLAQLPH